MKEEDNMDNHPLPLPQPSHLPQGLSLQAILSAFNNPISEEQAWALCHQLVKHVLQELQLEAYDLPNEQLNQRNKLPTINSLEDVIILKDGNVKIRENRRPSSAKPSSASTTKFLSSLGGILFKALDYGLSEQEEPILSPSLEKLIECLADDSVRENGHPDDGHHAVDSCDPDEGIERDAGESEPLYNNNHNAHENHNHQSHRLSHRMSLQYVLESCVSRIRSLSTTSTSSSPSSLLSSPSSMSSNDRYRQAESHYRAVCRALVVESDELMAFLTQVSKGTKELKETCNNFNLAGVRDSPLDFLESTDWARLWMQVMRELRNGVNRLNHVDSAANQAPRLHEYELTPYEMLLKDIRSKSYTLRHVVPSEDHHITQRVKKDAHEMILEFIRSRPPLKPADQRRLSTPVKSSNLHEQLMNSIKKERTLKPLPRMARLRASLKECGVPLGRVVTPSPEPPRDMGNVHPITSTPVRRKKLIKADLDVKLSIGLEDDFDISDTKLNESDAIDALKSEFYQSLTISNGHRDMDSSGIASSPTNTTPRSIEGRGRGNWAFPRLRRLFAFF